MEAIADPVKCGFKVLVDTGSVNGNRLNLFESWLRLWCLKNCRSEWEVTQNDDHPREYQLIIKFESSREAVHFRLVSGALHIREHMSHFLTIH